MIKYVYSNSSLRLFPFWELKGFIFEQGAHKEHTRVRREKEREIGDGGLGMGAEKLRAEFIFFNAKGLPPFIAPFLALCLSDIRVTCVLRMQAPSSA